MALAVMMSIAVLTSGCVTRAEYCDVAGLVRPSVNDVLTDGTKRALLAELEKQEKLCGAKP